LISSCWAEDVEERKEVVARLGYAVRCIETIRKREDTMSVVLKRGARSLLLVSLVLLLGSGILYAGGAQEEGAGKAKPEMVSEGVPIPPEGDLKSFFKGKQINIGVLGAGERGAISGALYYWREEWEAMTGAKLNIIEVPIAQIREKLMTDLYTGAGGFDGFDAPVWLMGDLIKGGFIYNIEDIAKDPRFPQWTKESVVEPMRFIHEWEGKWYLAPNDYDNHTLNYRKDILTDPQWKAAFKRAKGYEYSVPPRTWKELADIAEFFHGKDWDNDGKPDHGITQSWKKGEQAMWHFISLATPYVVLPGNNGKPDKCHNIFWFDPETMEPLINTPGFVRAMEMAVRLYKSGSPAQSGWGLGEMWNDFLIGDAIFNFGYQDLGALVQDPERSEVQGTLGCSIVPGTMEVWDRCQNTWQKMDEPNFVTNTTGPSWSIFIFKQSKNPALVYHLAAFHAQEDISFWNITHGFTGINMGRYFEFFQEHGGTATIQDWVSSGWNASDAKEYERAVYENYFMGEVTAPYLDIPGAFLYADALDNHLQAAITGQLTPKQALDRTYQDWQKITDQLGREAQLRYYQNSIKYGQ
jgi:multiple sugar transport system substrate-binding protein